MTVTAPHAEPPMRFTRRLAWRHPAREHHCPVWLAAMKLPGSE
ncbi:hypothetical protein C7444_11044 [Sphaerotilus hippei]|uniref:Uncharacterized protein n=1 Tax=Sphaerotilus hippei TaxID=744406 RepID=A0A318H2U9_9BURK|nr:hypothetical protein C7444_11044 [Sphaerotilus hippei]